MLIVIEPSWSMQLTYKTNYSPTYLNEYTASMPVAEVSACELGVLIGSPVGEYTEYA